MRLALLFLLVALFGTCARAAGSDPLPLPLLTPEPVTGGEHARLEVPYLHLPVFLHARTPRVDKRHFSPVHAKNRETLPERVRRLLLPEPRRRPKARDSPSGPVRVTCGAREMRVRVHTASLGNGGGRVHVRLGSCEGSRRSAQSVVFQFALHACATQRRIINNTVVYSNMLHYTSDAGVSGSGTFSVPVRCHFNRFHYSYKIGFVPSVGKLKYFKPMKTKGSVTLTACDAQWNKLAPAEGFIIGQPMFFQAETLHVAENQRLFVHFCHVTANSSRDSTPHVNIINNYGCLMDSRRSRSSRFINSSERNVVRFTIDAFVLQERVQKYLFIHCEMSIRSSVPTETSKSCSYNLQEKRWEELYGVHSVCSCCGSSCIPETTLTQPVTSELTTVVQRHPQEKSRITPTHSSEGTFTPKPEEEILPTGRDDAASEHRLGTVTLTPDSESGIVTQETDHGEITLQREPTPETYTGPLSPHSTRPTPTPDGEQGVPDREQVVWTPDSSEQGLATSDGEQGGPDREQVVWTPDSSEQGLATSDGEQGGPDREQGGPDREQGGPDREQGGPDREQGGPDREQGGPDREQGGPDREQGGPDREQGGPDREQGGPAPGGEQGGPDREQGGPAPDSEHGKITPEGGASPESEHGLPTPDSEQKIPMADVEHGKITPEGAGTEEEHRSLTQAHEDGSLMLDHKQGVDLVEAPPTLESRDGSPDTEHRHVTPNLQEQGATLAPSAGQNLISPVYKYTEPYRIFEEVFGIS